MDLPLSVLVTRPSEPSQRWFATEAARRVATSDQVAVEVTDDGLLIRGTTELALEIACRGLGEVLPGVKFQLNVEYVKGHTLQEPYYLVTVVTPEDLMGNVVADLTDRRGLIVAMKDSLKGKQIKAEVPVAECIGYDTVLRTLTHGRGQLDLEFIGYRPNSGPRGGEPINVD